MITKDHLIAFASGAILAILGMWLLHRPTYADSQRMQELVRDSAAHAEWAQKRDEQRDSMNAAFRMKDDSLSWTREQLEYALHHRRPSRIVDNDSLHRAIEAELGMLRQRNR